MSRTHRLCCAFVLLSVMVLPSVVFAQETTPSEELALEAYRQGESERAVELYTAALSETDDSAHRARIQVQIAWNLFTMGRTDEVRTHFRIALTEEPNLSLPGRLLHAGVPRDLRTGAPIDLSGRRRKAGRRLRISKRPSRASTTGSSPRPTSKGPWRTSTACSRPTLATGGSFPSRARF